MRHDLTLLEENARSLLEMKSLPMTARRIVTDMLAKITAMQGNPDEKRDARRDSTGVRGDPDIPL